MIHWPRVRQLRDEVGADETGDGPERPEEIAISISGDIGRDGEGQGEGDGENPSAGKIRQGNERARARAEKRRAGRDHQA